MRREKKRIWVYLGFLALLLEMFLTGMSVTAAQKEEQQLLEESKIIADNVYRYADKEEYDICAEEGCIRHPVKYITNALLALMLALFVNFLLVIHTAGKRRTQNTELLGGVEKSFFNSEPKITKVKEETQYCPQNSGSRSRGRRGGGHDF